MCAYLELLFKYTVRLFPVLLRVKLSATKPNQFYFLMSNENVIYLSLPSNYRPISLTYTAFKVGEAIIKDLLMSYLLSRGLMSKEQHAFIKKNILHSQIY